MNQSAMARERVRANPRKNRKDVRSVGPQDAAAQITPPADELAEGHWLRERIDALSHLEHRRYRPTRMCLGCRERQPQDSLIRLQLTEDGVALVERQGARLPGRSAYLCPHEGCLEAVLRRGEIVFKRSKYDKIIVRLDARQAERLRYAFRFAARRLRGVLGVGPRG
jgi:predicted RNA-binding protein YlxR (DUF448 family)